MYALIPHSKPWINEADCHAVFKTMQSNHIASGNKVREFEKAAASYIGTKDSVAVGSGTAALILALKAFDVGCGDEIILPTYVCESTMNAVTAVGATPVFCDSGEYWNMTAETVERHISARTKAIIVVHIFGISADTGSFKKFNVPVIEDCAQAFGAEIGGEKVGAIGTVGIFSFHATKCLTTGEGGIATSNDIDIIEKMRMLRFKKFIASPMTDIQAALGLSQLARYDEMLLRRKVIAQNYFKALPVYLTEKTACISDKSIFFRFPLTIDEDFDKTKLLFEQNSVAVRRGVDGLLHRNMNLSDNNFPNAISLFRQTLSLPIYPALTADEQNIIKISVQRILGM